MTSEEIREQIEKFKLYGYLERAMTEKVNGSLQKIVADAKNSRVEFKPGTLVKTYYSDLESRPMNSELGHLIFYNAVCIDILGVTLFNEALCGLNQKVRVVKFLAKLSADTIADKYSNPYTGWLKASEYRSDNTLFIPAFYEFMLECIETYEGFVQMLPSEMHPAYELPIREAIYASGDPALYMAIMQNILSGIQQGYTGEMSKKDCKKATQFLCGNSVHSLVKLMVNFASFSDCYARTKGHPANRLATAFSKQLGIAGDDVHEVLPQFIVSAYQMGKQSKLRRFQSNLETPESRESICMLLRHLKLCHDQWEKARPPQYDRVSMMASLDYAAAPPVYDQDDAIDLLPLYMLEDSSEMVSRDSLIMIKREGPPSRPFVNNRDLSTASISTVVNASASPEEKEDYVEARRLTRHDMSERSQQGSALDQHIFDDEEPPKGFIDVITCTIQ